MTKRLVFLSLTTLLFAAPALAATVYSHVVVSSNASIASGGTSAPDDAYAEVTQDNGYLEFGFPVTTTSDIRKVYVYEDPDPVLANRPWIKIEFMNVASVVRTSWQRVDGTTPAGNLSTYIGDDPFDRVRFTKLSGDPLRMDSVWLVDGPVETSPDPIVPSPMPEDTSDTHTGQPAPDTETEHTSSYPRLVKLEDDGDPNTQHDTAVYAVDPDDGKRRPFFNETIYFSWFTDFSRVEILTPETMAAIPLGKPMWMHHGTWLVKVQSTNDVHAVERGGVLRRLDSETTAAALYGSNWAMRVRDLSPTDWPHYSQGEVVDPNVYPDDTIVRDASLVTWHVRNGVRRQIPHDDLAYHGVQEAHVLSSTNANDLSPYLIGAMYDRLDNFGWFDY
ncbi:hypothetical protein A3B32_00710 [Candidatus Uhrbacteria bacterium RIFCSPLOWO2_01_FULL_53_9]|uniref:Uncharacterized protein n=1 Tax=Candidatus Uhrbacteria bacterium RIFCSPLOWO2_01_FULL_53_9 TaxID=1802403 RepID=A0A1F7UXE8_9BACT|nr:MAG: hypothetical protein A3B32_00710 [Candidatus Uhrbacteria bacterium RIFCSPLOWO2_01_FULL_53_9]